jgi:hypothetical protein
LAEGDFEGVWCVCALSVADAFELAVELGCGVVGVSVFFFVSGFGLALFDGVVEVGLGHGLEGDEDEAESGGGGVKTAVIRVGGLFSAVLGALEEKYGGEEREKGEKGPVNDEIDVHDVPLRLVAQTWIDAPNGAAAMLRFARIRLAREEDAGRGWALRGGSVQ